MHRLGLQTILALLLAFSARAQWTEPVRIGAPGGYLYPQILAVGDTLHVVGSNLVGGDKVVYLRSDDAGDTWGESHVLSDTVNSTNAMFVRIVKNGQNVMVLWRSISDIGQHPWNIGYALSHNNGDTWTEPLYVLDPGWDHISYFSASGDEPVVNVIVSRYIGYDIFFYSVRSTNFGESWSEPVELFRAAQGFRLDQATSGNIVYHTWSGRYTFDEKIEIYYMRSTDDGVNWSPSFALSDSDQYHSQLPAIAADDSGNVGATWMDYKFAPPGATGDIFIKQSADSGSYWRPESYLTSNHFAVRSDVVVTGDTLYVVWEDESQSVFRRRIYCKMSTDNGANWSQPFRLDDTQDDSKNPTIAASNSRVYAIWSESRDDPDMGLYLSRYDYETGVVYNDPDIPTGITLEAYPNPFNSNVSISLNMKKGGDAEIAIYDINGRLVKTIFKGGKLKKGAHKFTWDATDASGKEVSSGSYFTVASTPQGKITKTLTLIR